MALRNFFFVVFLFLAAAVLGQNDTIRLVNNDVLVGELKKMDRSVLTFKTKYSDSDFKIKWHEVLEVNSDREFIVAFSDGTRITSALHSVADTDRQVTIDYGVTSKQHELADIVFLEPIGKSILSNLTIDVDLGLTLTKTNNLRQFTTNINGTYLAKKWRADALFKTVISRQDGASDVNRMDGEVGFNWYLPDDWFLGFNAIYLSNDEQLLDLRSTYQVGAGYFFIHTNSYYLGASAGLAYTTEVFKSDEPNAKSTEAYLGVGFNKYDIGDLSTSTTLLYYPSLSDSGRHRVNLTSNLKYDLPLDFYIKFSLTYNYDSKPTEGASDNDYVFTTSFGWEFN